MSVVSAFPKYAALIAMLLLGGTSRAASLPEKFAETRVAAGLSNPTAMAIAPDGRIFVAEQGGALRIVKNGALLSQPYVTLSVDSSGERGLLGVAFHPSFAGNGYVYVYYTTSSAPIHNRVSRFMPSSANPDLAAAGSEMQLVNLPTLSANNHNGGAIHFGIDGRLYVAVGENAVPSNSQSLSNPLGKLLRFNSDGTIPADNPFYFQNTGINRAIWAYGLRNPFNFAQDPTNGRIHVNDVGQNSWEEVNLGAAGANYGWPQTEGPEPAGVAGVRYPIHAYQNAGSNCAITGSAFYRPVVSNFPPEYAGRYFFGDLCGGFIRTLSPPNYNSASEFATGISSLVDIQVHPDGSLYYLTRGGELFRVQSTAISTVYSDDFEQARGWTLTGGANTASRGLWQRGDPQPTTNAFMPLQLDDCEGPSTNCLVTGLYAGDPGSADVDDGLTSIQSPPIAMPSDGTLTLTFRFYFAHNDNATTQDLFRVRVVGNNGVPQTVFARPGGPGNVRAVWTTRSVDLSAWAGQTVQLRVEAYDGAAGSLIEAGFDNVIITRQ